MCIAQRTIAGAPGLSAPAVRTERLLFGLQMSPQPRRTICRFLLVGVGQGRAGRSPGRLVSFPVPEGDSRVGSVWFGPVCSDEGSRVSSGVLPAAVIYSQALQ
ncbi:hypothetical protein VZT92_010175 [Zoarces viviparus]|uniref:Uncharacterized protein n=1 Tax=Zoarces viviparus TaxID=48416 RepID=A0AAW1FDP4_ZOAVI